MTDWRTRGSLTPTVGYSDEACTEYSDTQVQNVLQTHTCSPPGHRQSTQRLLLGWCPYFCLQTYLEGKTVHYFRNHTVIEHEKLYITKRITWIIDLHCDSLQFFLILNTYDMVSDTCISFLNGIKHLAQKVWHIPLVHCIFFNDHLTNLISSNHSIHIKKILNHISWYKLSKSMVFHH